MNKDTLITDSSFRETIKALFIHGPLFDGDIPSKSGRDKAVDGGYVFRFQGYQSLTILGLELALNLNFDRDKERYYRALRESSSGQ